MYGHRCLEEETQSDYVIFSNFNVAVIDRKMSPLCGNHVMTGSTFEISDGNFFRVSFKSNDVFDAIGFNAFYEFRTTVEGSTRVNVLWLSALTITKLHYRRFVRIPSIDIR